MEQETILYYYPMPDAPAGSRAAYAAKRHWFQDAVLKTEMADRQEEFCVLGCAVPPFYYRKRPWKAQALSGKMEHMLGAAAGMTDTYVHPAVQRILTAKYCARWMPRAQTVQMLAAHLLERYGKETLAQTGMATVLLGEPADYGLQMEMTWELLQPYLCRINRMWIYCEETDGTEAQEELQEYLEAYYYEYGLVPQLCRRKERCGGVILDYCGQFQYPRIMAEKSVYLDILSVDGKELILRKKSLSVPYVSPLKYLDTVVKNSYDRKVNIKA